MLILLVLVLPLVVLLYCAVLFTCLSMAPLVGLASLGHGDLAGVIIAPVCALGAGLAVWGLRGALRRLSPVLSEDSHHGLVVSVLLSLLLTYMAWGVVSGLWRCGAHWRSGGDPIMDGSGAIAALAVLLGVAPSAVPVLNQRVRSWRD